MAKLYTRLQVLLASPESRPKSIVSQQQADESVFLVHGRDDGRQAWHYVLVPTMNQIAFKSQPGGSDIDVTDYGRIIQYSDHQGAIRNLSGWGESPSMMIQEWINDNYGMSSRSLRFFQ